MKDLMIVIMALTLLVAPIAFAAEKECQAQLAKDCKGLAIGKYCGMKHRD